VTPQRRHAFRVAVWLAIASEALLFSGLFMLYASYRSEHSTAFHLAAAEDVSWIGGTNTMILLTSSFAMAVAIHFARLGRRGVARGWAAGVIVLGCAFLAFKGYEWSLHLRDGIAPGAAGDLEGVRGASLFFTLYYLMTGLHALHVIAGMLFVAWARHRTRRDDDPLAIELVGVYWHFVDVVWVFLWPLFYLVT
jgi:cytochrome c oxidase subunit 3